MGLVRVAATLTLSSLRKTALWPLQRIDVPLLVPQGRDSANDIGGRPHALLPVAVHGVRERCCVHPCGRRPE